jgi:hypothetical protein
MLFNFVLPQARHQQAAPPIILPTKPFQFTAYIKQPLPAI